MTKYALLIFKNLLRSKRRTILTIISIAVSLFIFALLVSLPTFVNQVLADTSSSVRISCHTKMGWDYPLAGSIPRQSRGNTACSGGGDCRIFRRNLPRGQRPVSEHRYGPGNIC